MAFRRTPRTLAPPDASRVEVLSSASRLVTPWRATITTPSTAGASIKVSVTSKIGGVSIIMNSYSLRHLLRYAAICGDPNKSDGNFGWGPDAKKDKLS